MQAKQRYWDMVMAGIYGLRDKMQVKQKHWDRVKPGTYGLRDKS
jgi:hypothetical protein